MAYTTINKSSDYFNTVLYSGNDSTQVISGVGFQPNLTWVKNRTDTLSPNLITDVILGYGSSGNTIKTDASDAQQSNSTYRFVDNGATSDGFTVGNSSYTNGNGKNYVGWNWKVNNSTSANTDGNTNSTVSVNTTSGISIVSWTGTGSNTTIGHGLGVAPKVVWVKNRNDTEEWRCGHTSQSSNFSKGLHLSTNDSEWTQTGAFNDTAPTSSVFSVGTFNSTNGSGDSLIAYCFAEKTGYSKFGIYTGNEDADGPFVYCGFKPAMVIIKKTTGSTQHWNMNDNKRDTYNVMDNRLYPSQNAAEAINAAYYMDYLSNGFKIRTNSISWNADGVKYVFFAWAEAPLVGSNNVPCTAR